MTFKVTSGWTGSRIFRLAVVDIPIQCVTSITLGHQIRALPKVDGWYSTFACYIINEWQWPVVCAKVGVIDHLEKFDFKKKCPSDCHQIIRALSGPQGLSNKIFVSNSVEQIPQSWGVGHFKGEVWYSATLKVGGTIFFYFDSVPWG